MPLGNYDKLFGGVAGAAEKTRAQMRKTYGAKRGDAVFWGTVAKREHRAKRNAARGKKTKARRS